jgi:RimJ/RimL family protein N-acetyltransferase
MRLVLRPATRDDAELLLAWRNDPEARRQSLDTSAIELAPHVRWLERRLADTHGCRIYIAEREGVPIGQLRVEADGGIGVVSVSIDASARGAGLGRELIEQGTERAAGELALDTVQAVVRPGNEASLQSFAAAGYRRRSGEQRDGQQVDILEWTAAETDYHSARGRTGRGYG